jgi:hypothetical protein
MSTYYYRVRELKLRRWLASFETAKRIRPNMSAIDLILRMKQDLDIIRHTVNEQVHGNQVRGWHVLQLRFDEPCGIRSVRPQDNHGATPLTIMKPVRTPWKGSGPVFNGSVDSWVALANPVPFVQRESAFHKPPDWFGPGISLDPRFSNFPCWRDRRRVRPASRPVKGFEPWVPLTWFGSSLDSPLEGADSNPRSRS